MASYTSNLNLKKPAGSENVAIGDINNNMDAIDAAYGMVTGNMMIKEVANAASLADIETNLNSIISNMTDLSVRPVKLYVTATSGMFEGNIYMGHLYRMSSSRVYAMLMMYDRIIVGVKTSTWNWRAVLLSQT